MLPTLLLTATVQYKANGTSHRNKTMPEIDVKVTAKPASTTAPLGNPAATTPGTPTAARGITSMVCIIAGHLEGFRERLTRPGLGV